MTVQHPVPCGHTSMVSLQFTQYLQLEVHMEYYEVSPVKLKHTKRRIFFKLLINKQTVSFALLLSFPFTHQCTSIQYWKPIGEILSNGIWLTGWISKTKIQASKHPNIHNPQRSPKYPKPTGNWGSSYEIHPISNVGQESYCQFIYYIPIIN